MIGSRVSHYRIVAYQGGGAMGQVYRAVDLVLGRTVALKILPPYHAASSDVLERFLREARAASALDHPNVCTVYEIGQADDGLRFIAMAWCDGVSLQSLLQGGALPPRRAAVIALQIARGLAHAHAHGVVHRDIKPANVMVAEGDVVRIVDFGLAHLGGHSRLTMQGSVLGTAGYMSPEQVEGRPAGPAADVWALGVVLHEMLAGELPFSGDSNVALLKAVVDKEPRPLPGLGPGALEQGLAAVVARCLAKDSDLRFAGAADAADALAAALGGDAPELQPVCPDPVAPTLTIPPRPPRRAAAWLVLVPALLLIGLSLPPVRDRLGAGGLESGGSATPRGVAVLPFAFTGDDSGAVWFGHGLSWLVTDQLSRLEADDPGFWMAPPEPAKGLAVADAEVASRLVGLRRTIGGTGTWSGDRIVLEAVLVDSVTGIREARSFSDALANLKTWRQDLASWCLGALGRPGRPPDPVDHTTVPEAFRDCLIGLGHLEGPDHEGAIDSAAARFAAAVARDSSYALAWLGLGRTAWLATTDGDPDALTRAEACWSRAAALDPRSPWPHVLFGGLFEARGDDRTALASYERALSCDAVHAAALRSLAGLQRRLGEADAAQELYAAAVAARPGLPRAHMDEGRFYYLEGRMPEAVRSFGHAVRAAPRNFSCLNMLGAALFESDRCAEAESLFEHSLALKPNYVAFSNLGTLYYYDGRYADAADMARQSLAIYDGDYRIWLNLASALEWSGAGADSCRAAFLRARDIAEGERKVRPADPILMADLASIAAHLGRPGRSRELLAAAEALPGLDPEVMYSLADTWELLGDRNAAFTWLEQAVAHDLSLRKIDRYPSLRNLRSSERYLALQSRYRE
ncbi:MAG: protein kinase [Candidatus Krumholzibacteriia bacterium]